MSDMKHTKKLDPVHPGEILLEEFLMPLNITQSFLAHQIGVSTQRVSEIARGKRPLTADIALRLARFFGTTPEFWLGLQMQYDLDITQDKLSDRINREVSRYRVSTS